MLTTGRAYRERRLLPATFVRRFGSGLLALALLFQSYIAERHFHAIGVATANAAITQAADFLASPFVPISDQHGDDCPLCQVLGLGASTTVPYSVFVADPLPTVDRVATAPNTSQPFDTFLIGHKPRGPPASSSTI
jgi:hypothetical protein